jgi:hypothetical protein
MCPGPAEAVGAGAKLRFKIVKRVGGGAWSGSDKVKVKPNGLAVTTKVKGGTNTVRSERVLRWWRGARRNPDHLQGDAGVDQDQPVGPDPIYGATTSPWNLYLDLTGRGPFSTHWCRSSGSLEWADDPYQQDADGPFAKRHRSVATGLGRECDEPGGTTVLGISANLVYPCPANTTEQNQTSSGC